MKAILFFSLPWVFSLLIQPSISHGAAPVHPQKTIGTTRSFPLEAIGDRCIPFPDARLGGSEPDAVDCRVSESGPFAVLGDQKLYYSLYCLIPAYAADEGGCGSDSFAAAYHRARALAIFVREGDMETVHLLLLRAEPEFELFIYRKPEMVETPSGPLLVVPVRIDGTGAGNASEYFLRTGAGWTPVEGHAWVEDLAEQVPKGYFLAKGIWPDLAAMTAVVPLYRARDPNCCPSGGEAHIVLGLQANRMVLKSVTFQLTGEAP